MNIQKERGMQQVTNYPSPEESIDPEFIIDFKTLTKSLTLDSRLPGPTFVRLWLQASNNNTFGMRSEFAYKVALSTLVLDIATHFRMTAAQSDHDETLYLAWSRVAADLNQVDAIFNLILYIVGFELADELLEFWSAKAFKILFQNINVCTTKKNLDKNAQRVHDVICLIKKRLPSYALSEILKLKISLDQSFDKVNTEAITVTLNSLVQKSAGILVINSITPSEDRMVRSTLKRYEPLTLAPTPLVPITEDLAFIKLTLDNKFPWFFHLTEKIIKKLLVRQLGYGDFYLPPILLLGAPGIGKTYYVKTLCELLNVPFRTVSMSGKSDNRDLAGTARGWTAGHPSMPITLIQEHQIANPLIVLDELDKCGGSDHNGHALDTLLTLFEQTSSVRIFDEYLCGNIDLSHITWIATGNDVKNLPAPLLSRLEVITINKPEKGHYPKIVKASMQSFCRGNGIHLSHIPPINEFDWKWFEKYYTSPRVAKRAAEHWLTNRLLNANLSELN